MHNLLILNINICIASNGKSNLLIHFVENIEEKRIKNVYWKNSDY